MFKNRIQGILPAKKATFGAKHPYVEAKAEMADHLGENDSVSSKREMEIVNNFSDNNKSDDNCSNVSDSKKPKADSKKQILDLSCIPRKKAVATKKWYPKLTEKQKAMKEHPNS